MPRMSPGDGITPVPLSREPLATEGEATPGPDDVNPFDDPDADVVDFERPAGPSLPPTEDPDLPPLTRGRPLEWPTF